LEVNPGNGARISALPPHIAGRFPAHKPRKHPTSNIERPTSNSGTDTGPWMFDVGCWMLGVLFFRFRGPRRAKSLSGNSLPLLRRRRDPPRPSDAPCVPEPQIGPLTPALSPSEGERENRRQLSGETRFRGRSRRRYSKYHRAGRPVDSQPRTPALRIGAGPEARAPGPILRFPMRRRAGN